MSVRHSWYRKQPRNGLPHMVVPERYVNLHQPTRFLITLSNSCFYFLHPTFQLLHSNHPLTRITMSYNDSYGSGGGGYGDDSYGGGRRQEGGYDESRGERGYGGGNDSYGGGRQDEGGYGRQEGGYGGGGGYDRPQVSQSHPLKHRRHILLLFNSP